ncbi:MAG: sulfotransferase family 2 domain-containing protein [Promethearchaeota archaeon]
MNKDSFFNNLKCFYEDWKCRRSWVHYSLPKNYARIYFYHIRKSGGTSINYMFLSLGGENPKRVYTRVSKGPYFGTVSGNKIYVSWNKDLIRRGLYFYAFSHIPKHKLSLPENTFTLTCLREPAKRIVSLYNMLYHYKINNIPHPCMKEEGKWIGDSFNDFLNRIPKRDLLNQIYMFSKNYSIDEAFENIRNCSHVMITEQFAFGIKELIKKLDLKLQPIHTRKSSINPTITTDEKNRLYEILQPEYELYDRVKDMIWNDCSKA